MDHIALLPTQERFELFSESAAKLGTVPAIVEKDFWVTWVLKQLFTNVDLSKQLMFKGGTSLSKVYGLVERFSEDIDLILDWQNLLDEDPLAERSNTRQVKLNKAINRQAEQYIKTTLVDLIGQATTSCCSCSVDGSDPHVINIQYPSAFPDHYLRPELRLEIGPLAAWLPYEEHEISCYAADAFPDLFKQSHCSVRVIAAERTFWEKATILHQEAHRPTDKPLPPRYSRHYYDLYRMASSSVKELALNNLELLVSVVEFKQRFYPRGWAQYHLAKPGSLQLLPASHFTKALRDDYTTMGHMIFGEIPDFDKMMKSLHSLQEEINNHPTAQDT